MDKLPNKPQRQDDKKPTTSSSQVLLYMLLIATSAGFFAFFFNWHNAVVFDYREFEELVKQSSKSPAATEGYIQVNRGTEKNPAIWRYSDIHDVKVGDREITGLVNQEEIDPKTGPPAGKLQLPKIARFRVNKSTEIDIGISELLGNLRSWLSKI